MPSSAFTAAASSAATPAPAPAPAPAIALAPAPAIAPVLAAAFAGVEAENNHGGRATAAVHCASDDTWGAASPKGITLAGAATSAGPAAPWAEDATPDVDGSAAWLELAGSGGAKRTCTVSSAAAGNVGPSADCNVNSLRTVPERGASTTAAAGFGSCEHVLRRSTPLPATETVLNDFRTAAAAASEPSAVPVVGGAKARNGTAVMDGEGAVAQRAAPAADELGEGGVIDMVNVSSPGEDKSAAASELGECVSAEDADSGGASHPATAPATDTVSPEPCSTGQPCAAKCSARAQTTDCACDAAIAIVTVGRSSSTDSRAPAAAPCFTVTTAASDAARLTASATASRAAWAAAADASFRTRRVRERALAFRMAFAVTRLARHLTSLART